LNANTTRSQIYKGILEGLAFEMSEMVKILADAAGEFQDVYVTGGGSWSALGLQLRSALSGRRLHVMKCPEAVCLGGAILGGVACGEYGSLREAVELVVRDVAVVSPDAVIAADYEQQQKEYRYLRSVVTSVESSRS
jgi:xylulokinase